MFLYKKILPFIFFTVIQLTTYAQCAMCKAVAESDLQSGGTSALGINNGIMYLMGIPYLLISIVGYCIYRHYRNNLKPKIKAD